MSTTPEIDSAITGGAGDALNVITTNMPVVFGVAVAFVAWKVGKRVLNKV